MSNKYWQVDHSDQNIGIAFMKKIGKYGTAISPNNDHHFFFQEKEIE
jgi:hypothetical protein